MTDAYVGMSFTCRFKPLDINTPLGAYGNTFYTPKQIKKLYIQYYQTVAGIINVGAIQSPIINTWVLGEAYEPRREPTSGATIRLATAAMATDFAVILNEALPDDPRQPLRWASEALDVVHLLEDQMSVYRPHTELSQLNRVAASRRVQVEVRLFELLCHARDISGAFSVRAGITDHHELVQRLRQRPVERARDQPEHLDGGTGDDRHSKQRELPAVLLDVHRRRAPRLLATDPVRSGGGD